MIVFSLGACWRKGNRLRLTKRHHMTAIALVLVVLAALGSLSCSRGGYAGSINSIAIGTAPLESSALTYIAEHRRFFADSGLSVTIRDYDTGAAAHNAMLKGEVDIATPAEYPLVGSAFKKEAVRAIASIDKVEYFFLVCRKDRGIRSIPDLKGKRIGVVRRTIAEFYLGRFLDFHGIDQSRVAVIDTSIPRSEEAIANGDVDAIITRPPHVTAIEKRLGDNAAVFPAQGSQALYAVLTARNAWISGRPDLVDRLLKSLARAERFILENPAEARAIVRKRLNFDDAYMATVWSQNQFSLTLDQSLIAALEDEARWMIKNGLTGEKNVPDFLDYVYLDALKEVKPGAVNIIR